MSGSNEAPQDRDQLILRPVRAQDEATVRAAQELLAREHFEFAFGLERGSFATHLQGLEDRRAGRNLAPGWVQETYLLAEVEGAIVGRVSLRHQLTDALRRNGGHIGFAVLPPYRRRGYAIEILRQALVLARAAGLARVLLTCDETNFGSQRAIESCGGIHADTVLGEQGTPRRRYWIELR